jgi:hypothetical protein
MAEETNDQRRRFLETTVITIAATQLGIIGYAAAQPGRTSPAEQDHAGYEHLVCFREADASRCP